MPSWSSASASAQSEDHETVVRRFVEASRRAEIVAVVNSARTEQEVAQGTVDELCEAFEAEVAFVAVTRPERGERKTIAQTGLTAEQADAISTDRLCRAALGRHAPETHRGHDLLDIGARHVALSPWTGQTGRQIVIGVARLYDEPFDAAELALLEAVTVSVGHALERSWLSAERDRHATRQSALARAGKSLSGSLVRGEVLQNLAGEVAGALEADAVLVYAPGDGGELEVVASVGAKGMTARVEQIGRTLSANAVRDGELSCLQPFEEGAGRDASGVAAPIRPYEAVEGVVVVAFQGCRWIDSADAELVAAFAELAAIGWRNATDHAAAKRAATLDFLTGCLNHGAFQDRLREEVARAERGHGPLSVAILDLDNFKAVNDRFGHLAGDALLRGVGMALQRSTRPYDQVARYGGDEFAVLLPDTDEECARPIVERAQAAITEVRVPGAPAVGAGAGIAAWRPDDTPGTLLQRADEGLLEGKRKRGDARTAPEARPAATDREDRRLRRLVTAGALGTRLSRMLDERSIAETAVIELSGTLGYDSCQLVRREADDRLTVVATGAESGSGADAGRITEAVRTCVRENRPVLLADARPSQLAVPVHVGRDVWGAVGVTADEAFAFEDDDLRLLQRIGDHVGTALQTATLHEQLEETHLGTAAALAAALEAKDRYTADHARSIADLAVDVGRRLGVDEEQLRDLRYGAVFHDIGKIAIPDAVLNKTGPLTETEFALVREHPVVGEQILAPVPFLASVRQIVRHDHERWDGAGYPDGLRGEDIPLGARIVLVVDAYHAMRSDRPYRRAMTAQAAREELVRNAGTQFDPQVVEALCAVLEQHPEL